MSTIKITAFSGSPRKGGNTDYLVHTFVDTVKSLGVDAEAVRLCDYKISPCTSCHLCIEKGECVMDDGMVKLYPKLLESDGILIASPVYFNNVSAQAKAFMDRTWSLRGRLKWKVGGAMVVGRRYGHESALNAIHSFFLKHEVIIAYRGVVAFAFKKGDIVNDKHALNCTKRLAESMVDLVRRLKG